MRTTVDLPLGVRRRAEQIAAERGLSLSSVVAELAVRGLAQLDEPVELRVDPVTGTPVLSLGRRVTTADVDAALDDE